MLITTVSRQLAVLHLCIEQNCKLVILQSYKI